MSPVLIRQDADAVSPRISNAHKSLHQALFRSLVRSSLRHSVQRFTSRMAVSSSTPHSLRHASVAQAKIVRSHDPLTSVEKAVFIWYVIDAMTHLCMELPWLILTLTVTVNGSKHWISLPWKEYAKADPRWGRLHDCTTALEVPTALLWGPLALALAYATYKRKPWRHFWQVICATGEIYGNWMTFGPEWLTGSPELNPHNSWVHKWVYLFYANILWLVIPLFLLIESAGVIIDACERSKSHRRADKMIGKVEAFVIYTMLAMFGVVILVFGVMKQVL